MPPLLAYALGFGHVAVEGTQFGAALCGLQIQSHALPHQRLEFDVRVIAERCEFEAKASAVDALHAFQPFGQQLVVAQGRVQHQQPVALQRACCARTQLRAQRRSVEVRHVVLSPL
jgi:hypothetical protein